MTILPKALAALLIVLGGATAWRHATGAAAIEMPSSIEAVGALVWAEAHCDVTLRLAPGAPKLMRDDLLATSGALDAQLARVGADAACAHAIKLSKSVVEQIDAAAPTAPADTIALSR